MQTFILKRGLSSLVSLAGLLVAVFFLSRLTGDPAALYLPVDAPASAREAFRGHWRTIVRLAAVTAFLGVGFYLAFVFAVTYLEDFIHVSDSEAFDINTVSM